MERVADEMDKQEDGKENEMESESKEEYAFKIVDNHLWQAYLEVHGYCVITSVASSTDVSTAVDMIWSDMRELFHVERNDLTTWGNIPNGPAGILSNQIPQTRGVWSIRGLETIREVYRNIWETDELLVSMDSVLCWHPWWINPSWRPFSEGLHVDQNPFNKPNKCCVQGMVPLIDVSVSVRQE